MKIYFEDGELLSLEEIKEDISDDITFIVDAKYGITHCDTCLFSYNKTHPNAVIFTNSILALSNSYAWNKELKRPEIYIRNKDRKFVNIAGCTTREIKEGHNLAKLYLAGEFSDYKEKENGVYSQVAHDLTTNKN